MPEIPAERYRREAAACRIKAEETANSVDKEAWLKLGEDWDELARGVKQGMANNASHTFQVIDRRS